MEQIWAYFSWWDGILLGGLSLCTAVIISFYWRFYRPIYKRKKTVEAAEGPVQPTGDGFGVSVVISGQNQYENLKQNLPFWLDQKYPHFEVIVVYDYAEDDLHLLLNGMQDPDNRLRRLQVDQNINFFDQEKFALSIGLKSAAYPYVLLVSSECRPENQDCLQHIAACLRPDTRVAAAYGLFPARQGSALARYYHDERILQSLGLILAGQPDIASHHALIYRKDLFLEHKGYTAFYTFNIGQYDSFAHYLNAPGEAGAIADKAARLRYTSRLSFGRWLRDERRYLNACRLHPGAARKADRLYRSTLFAYHLLVPAWLLYTFLTRFPDGPLCWLSLGIFALLLLIKCSFQMIVHFKAHRQLGESRLWWLGPGLEWLYLALCPFWLIRRRHVPRPHKRKKRV